MNPIEQFNREKKSSIQKLGKNAKLKSLVRDFMTESDALKYTYNFTWLGRPIIQLPQDMIAVQELIWQTKPDLIIETGIAHGGSLIFSASMLELIGKKGEVIGIDIDIRKHNRKEIEKHPMFKRITLIEGSSISDAVLTQVAKLAKGKKNIMVMLDSNHTHDHVLRELELYSPFVKKGNYLIAFDTVVEDMPKGTVTGRPWDKGSNPKTAVQAFLKKNRSFKADMEIDNKLLLSVAPGGYLRRIS